MENILNYIKVDDYIATSGQPSKKELKKIAKNGFEVVINLALHDSHNALKNEDKIVSKNGMMYFHIPVSWEKPEADRLEYFLHILKLFMQMKKRVFIHCAMNYRVSMFMYMYKQIIFKDENAQLICPKDFLPNQVWDDFMQASL